jgi:hypothetical protein
MATARVGQHAGFEQAPADLLGVGNLQREEAAEVLPRARRLERLCEQRRLPEVVRAQRLRGQAVLGEEVEDAGGPVVARRVVRGAGEAHGAPRILDPARLVLGCKLGELGEPAGERGP